MPNYKKRYLVNLSLIVTIGLLGIFAFGVKQAEAGILNFFVDFSFEAIAWMIAKIGAIIHSIFGILFSFVGLLLDMAFGLEKFTEAGIVQIGWVIVRDLVNMFFVLILLAIALATILRVESYGIKALLPKLIIVAVLINFSLVIAGAVIDFSQVLTHFFYDEIRGDTGISGQIAKMINIQKVWELNDEAAIPEKIAAGVSGIVMTIFSIFFGIILILAATFVIGAGAFFLIVRLIMLWILLILAPLAWFLWILPNTSNLFRQWWNSFLKWTFFAPIYAFFVYLAIKAANSGSFSSIIQVETDNIINASGWKQTVGSTLAATPQLLLQFILIIGMLMGALIVAQKMGVYGAQGIVSTVRKAGKGTGNFIGRRAQSATTRQLTGEGRVGRMTQGMDKAAVWMTGQRGLKTAGRLVRQAPRTLVERERASIAKLEKDKYKDWTSNNIKSSFGAADANTKIALGRILASRGDLKTDEKLGFNERNIQETLVLAKRYDQQGDMLKARPDLAPSIKDPQDTSREAIEKVISKMKPADMEKLQSEALTSEVMNVIYNELSGTDGKWNSSYLSKMSEVNPKLKIEIKKNVIDDPAKKSHLRKDIVDWLNSEPGKAIYG